MTTTSSILPRGCQSQRPSPLFLPGPDTLVLSPNVRIGATAASPFAPCVPSWGRRWRARLASRQAPHDTAQVAGKDRAPPRAAHFTQVHPISGTYNATLTTSYPRCSTFNPVSWQFTDRRRRALRLHAPCIQLPPPAMPSALRGDPGMD